MAFPCETRRRERDSWCVWPRARAGAPITGVMGEGSQAAVKIALQAPPVEGRANAALIDFLAEWLRVGRSSIEIASGAHGRNKSDRSARTHGDGDCSSDRAGVTERLSEARPFPFHRQERGQRGSYPALRLRCDVAGCGGFFAVTSSGGAGCCSMLLRSASMRSMTGASFFFACLPGAAACARLLSMSCSTRFSYSSLEVFRVELGDELLHELFRQFKLGLLHADFGLIVVLGDGANFFRIIERVQHESLLEGANHHNLFALMERDLCDGAEIELLHAFVD